MKTLLSILTVIILFGCEKQEPIIIIENNLIIDSIKNDTVKGVEFPYIEKL